MQKIYNLFNIKYNLKNNANKKETFVSGRE